MKKEKRCIHVFVVFIRAKLTLRVQLMYLLVLWDDLMFLAEMMFRDRTASAALSSTSALLLIRPDGT